MSRSDWFGPADGDEGGADGPEGSGAPPTERPRQTPRPRRRGPLGPTIAILAVLAFLGSIAAELVTDLWWFDSVGFRSVFLTELGTKALLFVAAFLITALALAGALVAAYRTRPLFVPTTPGQLALEQYRQLLDPLRKIVLIAVPVIFGLLAGSGSLGAWKSYLLWRNGGSFGVKDPQFGLDVGFYVFTLPWLSFLVGFITVVLSLALIANAMTHYVYGGLQLPGRGPSTRAAFLQLSVLGALILLTRGGAAWLDRYALTTRQSDLVSRTGMTYSDVNAVMPGKAILAIAAVVCAGLFLASIWTRSWRLPIIGIAAFVIVSIVVGTIYPAALQSLRVRPSLQSLERPYIQRNIDATQSAYGLDRVDRINNPTPPAQPDNAQLRQQAANIPGIRIIDPAVVAPSFRQLEGRRDYYAFPDILDVDRYTVDGSTRDAVVAVREINLGGLPDQRRNWLNDHTVYTHGYGFYAAYGNQRTSEGDPVFFERGDGAGLGEYEPRIYFGEISPNYSVVGDAPGSAPREFDQPGGGDGSVEVNNTYAGEGGVEIGSLPRQLAYALKYREVNFLLSDRVNEHSRILDHRTPSERVERVAPWLTLDGNVYPAVIDGRIKWIVDGFTTSAHYPNSRLIDLQDATSDSVTERSRVVAAGAGQVNYVRNAVKATVDAFDGSVTLYAWAPDDPMLKAWTKAFPTTVRPLSEVDSELMQHIRYPQDLLKIQRQMLAEYHVSQADPFFTGSDRWRVPRDPNHATQDLPVYFQSLAMPGQESPAFSLTTPFVPDAQQAGADGGREILRGLLAVDADAGSTAGKPSENFGTLRLLQYGNQSPAGPGQVLNMIRNANVRSQNPAEQLNLAGYIATNSGQGRVLTYGNLLSFPLGGQMFYVQPIYVQQERSDGSYPQNKVTAVVYGTTVAWGDTLEQALTGLFGEGAAPQQQPPSTGDSPQTPPATSGAAQLAALITQMQTAQGDMDEAMKKGDWAEYGKAQTRLKDLLKRASDLSPSVTAGASPSPSASPTPAPSPSG